MYINSPGGVVTSGLAIYDTCSSSARRYRRFAPDRRRRWARCCWPRATRTCASRCRIRASWCISPPAAFRPGHRHHAARPGDPEPEETAQRDLCEHTGQTFKAIEDALERDKFLTAEMARDFGIVDKVIDKRSEDPTVKTRNTTVASVAWALTTPSRGRFRPPAALSGLAGLKVPLSCWFGSVASRNAWAISPSCARMRAAIR